MTGTCPINTGNIQPVGSKTYFAPATCGELVQGATGNIDYLINFPIDLYSVIRGQRVDAGSTPVVIRQDGSYAKVIGAVKALTDFAATRSDHTFNKLCESIELDVLTSIPRGKGLASSSSEIASALSVAARLLDIELRPEISCLLAATIEATDCVQAPGISLVTQLDGRIREQFTAPDDLAVIMIDCGGEVTTDDFDRKKFHHVAEKNSAMHAKALRLAVSGLKSGCKKSIGLAATISASINQRVLFKRQFSSALRIAQEANALGVNCAHSGTVLGVLYDRKIIDEPLLLNQLVQEFGREAIIGTHQMINGGSHEVFH